MKKRFIIKKNGFEHLIQYRIFPEEIRGTKIVFTHKSSQYAPKKKIENIDVSRYDNLELRTYMAKKFISDLIEKLGEVGGFQNNKAIINYWLEYTSDFKNEQRKENILSDDSLYKLLMEKKDLFLDILKDRVGSEKILEDQDISPKVLGVNSKATIFLLEYCLEEIGKNYIGKDVKIAVIDDYTGVAKKLLMEHNSIKLNIDYFQMEKFKGLEQSLIEPSLKISDILTFAIKENLSVYDHIILINNLHMFDNPRLLFNNISCMLKKSGNIHIIDFLKMDPMSVLVASFFHKEKLHQDDSIRDRIFYRKDYIITNMLENYIDIKTTNYNYDQACYFKGANFLDYKNVVEKIALAENIDSHKIVYFSSELYDKYWKYILDEMPLESNRIEIQSEVSSNADIVESYEKLLKRIWMENLHLETVEKNTNYFRVGGDSLSATRLVVAIEKKMGIKISLNEIFNNADFNKMVDLIELKDSSSEIVEGEI